LPPGPVIPPEERECGKLSSIGGLIFGRLILSLAAIGFPIGLFNAGPLGTNCLPVFGSITDGTNEVSICFPVGFTGLIVIFAIYFTFFGCV
jgi:hypothetical protein